MKSIAVFAVFFSFSLSHANESDLKGLMNAKSESELNRQRQILRLIRIASISCETQMKGNDLPLACFQRLQLEKKSSGAVELEANSLNEEDFVEICVERAAKQTEISTSSLTDIPNRCADAIRDRKADLAYRASGT